MARGVRKWTLSGHKSVRIRTLVVVAGVATLPVGACGSAQPPATAVAEYSTQSDPQGSLPDTGTLPLAHSFTLEAQDGSMIRLEEQRGKWVLVNFWATWCGPCKAEVPYLQELANRAPENLIVLGINQREEPVIVNAFADEHGISFPLLLNPDDETLLAYDIRGLPATAVVAPDGTLVRIVRGPIEPADFDPWLEAALSANTPELQR